MATPAGDSPHTNTPRQASRPERTQKMKLKKYLVYMDDGRNCFKLAIPAEDESSAREYVAGNGDVIAVKDVTEDYPISLDCVSQALRARGFGQVEIDLILRTLSLCEIAE